MSRLRRLTCAASLVALLGVGAGVAAQDLPVVKGKKVVAIVDGEPITLDEFTEKVSAMKSARRAETGDDEQTEPRLLRRMVNLLLITQEARRMGFDKLPELRKQVDVYARETLREELVGRSFGSVKPDPKAVEDAYRAAVRQWKVSAALFGAEDDAKPFAADVAAGKDFVESAKALLAGGKAKKVQESGFVKRSEVDPPVAAALAALSAGQVSAPIRTGSGFVVVLLQGERYPDEEDRAARTAAEQSALAAARNQKISELDAALRKKYATVDDKLLQSVDFEAEKPGIEALARDRRVVVRIKGEAPITVADVAEEMKFRFYHGVERAVERKRLNSKKAQVVEGMVYRRVFRKEALRLGIDKSDAYRRRVTQYENSLLFDAFIRKAIAPGITLTEERLKAYYGEHRSEYSSPEMVRLRSLVFASRQGAEVSLASLQTGADFAWVAAHADEQVAANAAGVLTFDNKPIVTTELPDGVRTAIAGAKPGDARLYASGDDRFYVLVVETVIPPVPVPYEDARKGIVDKIVSLEIKKAIEEYADKLRAVTDVKVYLKAS